MRLFNYHKVLIIAWSNDLGYLWLLSKIWQWACGISMMLWLIEIHSTSSSEGRFGATSLVLRVLTEGLLQGQCICFLGCGELCLHRVNWASKHTRQFVLLSLWLLISPAHCLLRIIVGGRLLINLMLLLLVLSLWVEIEDLLDFKDIFRSTPQLVILSHRAVGRIVYLRKSIVVELAAIEGGISHLLPAQSCSTLLPFQNTTTVAIIIFRGGNTKCERDLWHPLIVLHLLLICVCL